jgi:hypothetical protein
MQYLIKENFMSSTIIKTSEEKWLSKLADAYKYKINVTLIDDLKIGIDPTSDNLIQMGIKAQLSIAEWTAVGISVGISAAGITMIVLAFVDPEPTSKLGLLIAGGTVALTTGGFMAVRILTKHKPPKVKVGPQGFEISWD